MMRLREIFPVYKVLGMTSEELVQKLIEAAKASSGLWASTAVRVRKDLEVSTRYEGS